MIPGQAQQFFEAAAAQAGGGFQIDRSLRFNSADSAYLNRTPSSAGNRRTFTFSCWVKRVKDDASPVNLFAAGSNKFRIAFGVGTTAYLQVYDYNGSSYNFNKGSAASYRDFSAWYHVVVAIDTTDSTADDRVKMYVNGSRITDLYTGTNINPSQNLDTYVNSTSNAHYIGYLGDNTNYLDAYLADVHFIDGQALAPTDFGEYDNNNVWQPKEFEGNYTTSGVSFDFAEQELYAGGTREALFDGSTSTGCNFRKTSASSSSTVPSNTKRIKVTFPTAKTGVTKLRIYGGGNTSSTNKVWYNDDESTMITNNDPVGWKTVYTGSAITINSISFGTSDGGSNLRAIEINDVVLTDAVEQGINSFRLDFSDASSNAALGTDSSGNNNDWTVNNLTSSAIFGVSFDGSGDRLKVADDADLAFGTGEFTVEMYFICDTVSGNDVLYDSRAATGNSSDGFSIVRNGNLLRTYTSGSYKVTSSTTLSTGQLYHLAVTRESTTQKMFLDGTLVGSATVSNDFSQQKATIGSDVNGSESWDGFISNVRLVKGTAVYTSNFTAPTGNLTNVTNTVLLCCQSSTSVTEATVSPGTITAFGNVFVKSTAKDIDSLIDTPTNYVASSGNNGGNYATLNPLYNDAVLANGNLEWNGDGSISHKCTTGTIGMSSGKYYWEAEYTVASYSYVAIGMQKVGTPVVAVIPGYNQDYAFSIISSSGTLYYNNTGSSYGVSWAVGDIIGVRYDNGSVYFYKNGVIMNGGTPAVTGLTGTWVPIVHNIENGAWAVNFGQRPFASTLPTDHLSLCTTNLPNPTIADGSTAFGATLWTGNGSTQTISGLNHSPDFIWHKIRSIAGGHQLYDSVRGTSKRLRSDTADVESTLNGVTAFNSDGWTMTAGNNSGESYVSWTWDAETVANPVGDIWQGSATKYIGVKFSSASGGTISFGQTSGSTTVEVWKSSDNSNWTQIGGTLTLSDGHTLTFTDQYVYIRNTSNATFSNWYAAATNGADGHYSSVTYPSGASWGGPAYTDYDWRDDGGVINTDGSFTSTVRANLSAGFSIIGYNGNATVGATIGHGLNSAPEWLVFKNRDEGAGSWYVYHKSVGPTKYLTLDRTHNAITNNFLNNTAPTNSVITLNNTAEVNAIGQGIICYAWTPVEGYSAFGSYTGNGSSDGPFVFCGFRPRWILVKNTSINGSNWRIVDTARNTYNEANLLLNPNSSNDEQTTTANEFDILSNGFKLRGTDNDTNGSAETLIYAAFAEHPFKTSRAR
jgi:hypothetical protein